MQKGNELDAGHEGVGDGGGEGVGGVVGFGRGGEVEGAADHFLHLFFVGAAVAGEGLFDLEGGVFGDGEVVLAGDEHGDAAGVGDGDGGGDVLGEEEFFDGDFGGGDFFDDFGEAVVDVEEAVGEGGVGGGGDDAAGEHGEGVFAADFDGAEAEDAGAGVEAEDTSIHEISVA